METLVLDGKSYVKASKAARDLGYTADYVGQLCRSGKVSAHLIGRTWYVDPSMLGEHRIEKKRVSRIKAREQVRKSLEEHKLKVTESRNIYKNIGIHYERDDSELIPETRKLGVETERAHFVDRGRGNDNENERNAYEILNAGEKVMMSGSVRIEDANEDAFDVDTTVLTPKFTRQNKLKGETSDTTIKHIVTPNETETATHLGESDTLTPVKMSFIDRLADKDAATGAAEVPQTASMVAIPAAATGGKNSSATQNNPSLSILLSICFGFLALGIASLGITAVYEYRLDRQDVVTNYLFEPSSIMLNLSSKI